MLSNHFYLSFYQELGMVSVKLLVYHVILLHVHQYKNKKMISDIPSYKQDRYKPVTNCNYWTVLGSFKNWKIIQLSQISTPYDKFDEIQQDVIDRISDNMDLLVESVKYGYINTIGTETNVIMFLCSNQKHINFRITQN